MKHSIRTRLFLSISCLIIFFVALSLLLNSQYLGKYYLWQKKQSLLEINKQISKKYQGNPLKLSLELEKLEQNKGLSIFFIDQDYRLIYSTSMRIIEQPSIVLSVQPKLNALAKGEYFTGILKDPRLETNFLVLASRLENNEVLVLSTPLAAIDESTTIANKFFLFTGLITIVIGGVAVFLFARSFTKPILQLNDIAQRMSKLDFSKKYTVQSDDEVGQLGKSINSLSDQLDKAIFSLTEANKKLMADIEQERRIDKMRKEFINNVSHELKTPIALIQGYAEGLKLNINEDEENKNYYCDVIMDEASKMNRLVKELLDLSQIESGYFNLDKTAFNLSSLIESVLDKYRPVLVEKGIKVELDIPESLTVNGDAVRIEQVLVNYLVNAINHTDDKKKIRIQTVIQNEKVRVSVCNSGEKIPDESLDKIWTSFYKVDKARTRSYGGTGLGLSVVKAIQELHGNSCGVENLEDGVLFWFEVDR
jgi:two-component system sensor histidine kinase VanS